MNRLLLLGVLLGAGCSSRPTTIYVSTGGVDTPSCGTRRLPCKTYREAFSHIPKSPRQSYTVRGDHALMVQMDDGGDELDFNLPEAKVSARNSMFEDTQVNGCTLNGHSSNIQIVCPDGGDLGLEAWKASRGR